MRSFKPDRCPCGFPWEFCPWANRPGVPLRRTLQLAGCGGVGNRTANESTVNGEWAGFAEPPDPRPRQTPPFNP